MHWVCSLFSQIFPQFLGFIFKIIFKTIAMSHYTAEKLPWNMIQLYEQMVHSKHAAHFVSTINVYLSSFYKDFYFSSDWMWSWEKDSTNMSRECVCVCYPDVTEFSVLREPVSLVFTSAFCIFVIFFFPSCVVVKFATVFIYFSLYLLF